MDATIEVIDILEYMRSVDSDGGGVIGTVDDFAWEPERWMQRLAAAISASPITVNGPGVGEVEYSDLGSELAAEIRPVYNVRTFGAVGSNATLDNAGFQAAKAAAQANDGVVYAPGNFDYILSGEYNDDRDGAALYGDGAAVTQITQLTGTDLDHLVRFGTTTASTTTRSNCRIAGLSLRGSRSTQTAGVATLAFINTPDYRCVNVKVLSAFDAGFLEDTEVETAGSSRSARGYVCDLEVTNCGGVNAMILRGAKNSRYIGLNVRNNDENGLLVQGGAFSDGEGGGAGSGNQETTQCTLADSHITDNGGIGLVCDNSTRWLIHGLIINFNELGGIQGRRSLGTAGTDGSNSNYFGHIGMRNNGQNAACVVTCISSQNVGDISNATFEGIELQPQTDVEDQIAVRINGGDGLIITSMDVRLASNVGIELVDCTNLQGGIITITACGEEPKIARTPHGLLINGGSGQINNLHCRNADTNAASGGYELAITGSLGHWDFGLVSLEANENGNELSLLSTQTAKVTFGQALVRNDPSFLPSITGGSSTAPPQLFMDRIIEVTGPAVTDSIPPLRPGHGYYLRYTNATPGGISNQGNVNLPGDSTLYVPKQNDLLHVICDGTNYDIVGLSTYLDPNDPRLFGAAPHLVGGATHAHLEACIAALPCGVLTVQVGGSPNTAAATLRIDTRVENGGLVDLTVDAGMDPEDEAADLRAAMIADRDVSSFFKCTVSGDTVTLRPRKGYASMRNVLVKQQAGSGLTITNTDGTSIAGTATAVALAPTGGTIPMRGLWDGVTGTPAPMRIDTPDVVLDCQPGTIFDASPNGLAIVEADGFRCRGLHALWQEEGGAARADRALFHMAASDWAFDDCELTIDSIGTAGAPEICVGILWDQVTGIYPEHNSWSFTTSRLSHNRFYLGNRTIGAFYASAFDIEMYANLFTSLFGRTNPYGNGNAYEAPLHAIWLRNCDYADLIGNRIMNVGGDSDATNSEAPLLVERTNNGYDQRHEGGHMLISGGRIHGTVDSYAAQMVLRNLWFADVAGVEMHRHIISTAHTPAHDRQLVGGISMQDCLQVTVSGIRAFNFGTDGTNCVNYPLFSVLSMTDPVSMAAGDQRKTLAVSNCTFDNKVPSTKVGTVNLAENAHAFLQYFNTGLRHRMDTLHVVGNTMITGGQATARWTVLNHTSLASGEGFRIVVPIDTFGSGNPAVETTINCRVVTEFGKQSNAFQAVVQAANYLMNTNADFSTWFRAMVGESSYAQTTSSDATATLMIEALDYGVGPNACTFEHLSSVSGTSSASVGSTAVAEGATADFEGGYGKDLATGQVAIALIDISNPLTGEYGPKQANIRGNTFRGWYTAVGGDTGVETINDWANENQEY